MQRRDTTTASAAKLGRLLCAGAGDPHDDRLRMCIGWYSEIEQIADLDVATALVVERPPTTGDPRFDALLAGLVEDLAARGLVRPPEWIYDPDRFLDVFWFPLDLPSLRIAGLRDAPAALARRCVFLDRRDLQRV